MSARIEFRDTVVTLLIVLAMWQSVVSFLGVSPYVAKGPVDVYKFLFVDEPGAAAPCVMRQKPASRATAPREHTLVSYPSRIGGQIRATKHITLAPT